MATRRRRVKDAAPYRVVPPDTRRTTGERPDQARPKRVTRVALWFDRTVATGGRTVMRQRPPRAGTFAPGPRAKLPRKRGPGGGRLRAPLGARRSRPPAILWWLSDRSESHSPPAGGEIPPNQTARCKTGGRGKPSLADTKGCKWDGRAARRVVAPYRGAPSDTRRTTGEHQGRRVLSR